MKRKKKTSAVIIMTLICSIALIGMVITLIYGNTTTTREFTPPPFDSNANEGLPNVANLKSWRELDTDAYKVGICGELSVKNGSAEIWMTNPKQNTIWMKLRIMDTNGNVLGETGLITPGQYIKSVSINTELQAGSPIIMKIMAYEPETYHSAGSVIINTTLE